MLNRELVSLNYLGGGPTMRYDDASSRIAERQEKAKAKRGVNEKQSIYTLTVCQILVEGNV